VRTVAISERPSAGRATRGVWDVAVIAVGVSFVGLSMAFLLTAGLWYVALAMVVAVPTFVLVHRRPLVAVSLWLFLAPFLMVSENAAIRKAFWLVHRLLPLGALAIAWLTPRLGVTTRRLPKLGWAEAMMGGYVVATFLSIAYTSPDLVATAILFYDRVMAPMCLYMVIRLSRPDEADIRWMVAATVFLLITQTMIGLMQWVLPGALPGEWVTHAGERTTGSFRDVNVYGVTMTFCALLLLHYGSEMTRGFRRVVFLSLSVLAMLMLFLTFSRASWVVLAILVVTLIYVQRPYFPRVLMVVVPALILLASFGTFDAQLSWARQRLMSSESDESALSRLPVVYASIRMFEAKPLAGWGYENFDRYDRQFQRRVGDLIYPDKDHASHNLYLTTLAEQGIIGLLLLLGPAFYWLFRSFAVYPRLPSEGAMGRKFLVSMWLVAFGFVIINNFVRMQVQFGLGLWWVALGLIAVTVSAGAEPDRSAASAPSHDAEVV
jgi:O-antigen ligase